MGAQTFVLHCFSHFFPSDIFPFHFVWRFLSSLNFSLPTNHFSATLYYAMLCRVWLFRMAHRSAPLRTPCDSVSFRFVIKTQLLFLNTDNVNCDSFFSLHLQGFVDIDMNIGSSQTLVEWQSFSSAHSIYTSFYSAAANVAYFYVFHCFQIMFTIKCPTVMVRKTLFNRFKAFANRQFSNFSSILYPTLLKMSPKESFPICDYPQHDLILIPTLMLRSIVLNSLQ